MIITALNNKIVNIIEGFKDQKILIIGDVILDRYMWGNVSRISPEAPVQVVNIEKEDNASGGDLIKMYCSTKVYIQISIHESFGISVAEAMICECIPVVSRRSALPEVVGDCGFYVDQLNPESVSTKIKEALSHSNKLGKKARDRVRNHLPLEKRKRELLAAFESLHS